MIDTESELKTFVETLAGDPHVNLLNVRSMLGILREKHRQACEYVAVAQSAPVLATREQQRALSCRCRPVVGARPPAR